MITSTTSVSKAAVSARDTKNSQHNEQFFRMGNAPGSIGLPSVSALNKNSRTGRSSTVYHRVVTIPEASIVASISKAGLLSLSHLESGIMVNKLKNYSCRTPDNSLFFDSFLFLNLWLQLTAPLLLRLKDFWP